jgi:hemolysin activation/secretion protein
LVAGLIGSLLLGFFPCFVIAAETDTFFVQEYRVEGARKLPRLKIERAVYRFLGPQRSQDDVEHARAALEQAYIDEGYQTVAVQIPQQSVTTGIIRLEVVERQVGRLRVKGAKYSAPSEIKALAPSLAEGNVINFNDVPGDMAGLNQLPDRQVTPSLHAGALPDTVDVDLEVKEKAPVHASLELNDRHGPDTTPLRATASVSASNLWQAGHSLGFTYQTAPRDTSEVKVFSGYYLMRFPSAPGFSLMLQGTKQDSNVSTIGDVAVAGRGKTVGLRGMFNLPVSDGFVQSASLGLNYKNYDDRVKLGATDSGEIVTPITYYPLEAAYSANWLGKGVTTSFGAGVNFNFRGVGGKTEDFGNSRFRADANYVIFHADLSQERDLPLGFQVAGKLQGQISDQPLISHEQASGGGSGTVRGYLEAEVVGDNAAFGSIELRSPSVFRSFAGRPGELRLYTFLEGGILTLRNPLPDQTDRFNLASYGVGTRLQLLEHFDGVIEAGVPLETQAKSAAGDVRVNFRAALDF